MVAGKMWNNNRLPSLLFGIDYFLSIKVLQDPLNRPINSLRIMNITEAVTKNEACHTINHGTVETIFFLLLIFLFECIINRIHHRNSPDPSFCLWKWHRKFYNGLISDRKTEKDQTTLWFFPLKRCIALKFFTSLRYTLMCVVSSCCFLYWYSFFLVFSTFVLSCTVLHIRSVF